MTISCGNNNLIKFLRNIKRLKRDLRNGWENSMLGLDVCVWHGAKTTGSDRLHAASTCYVC